MTVRDQSDEVLLTLGRWDGVDPPATFLDQAGPGLAPFALSWEAADNEHFVVLVQRQTGTGTEVVCALELETPLSLLPARPSIDTRAWTAFPAHPASRSCTTAWTAGCRAA